MNVNRFLASLRDLVSPPGQPTIESLSWAVHDQWIRIGERILDSPERYLPTRIGIIAEPEDAALLTTARGRLERALALKVKRDHQRRGLVIDGPVTIEVRADEGVESGRPIVYDASRAAPMIGIDALFGAGAGGVEGVGQARRDGDARADTSGIAFEPAARTAIRSFDDLLTAPATVLERTVGAADEAGFSAGAADAPAGVLVSLVDGVPDVSVPPGGGRVGRDRRDCSIVVDVRQVSSRHAELRERDGGYLVTDLGSTNGTRVNDLVIGGPMTVGVGDVLSFGRSARFRLGFTDSTGATGPAGTTSSTRTTTSS